MKILTSINSCEVVFFDTLTVDSLFKVSVSDKFKCKGTSILLEGEIETGTEPYTYHWFRNNTNGLPVNGPDYQRDKSYTANDTISTRYILRVQNTIGCVTQDTLIVKVKGIDSTDIITITSDRQCLIGNSFKFRVGALNNFHNPEYRWVYGDSIKTDSVISISYATKGTKTISLIVNETQGCADTATRFVRIDAMPQTTNVIMVNNPEQCLTNNNFIFTYSNANNPQQFSHTWLHNGIFSFVSPFVLRLQQAGTDTVKLVIAQNNGCADTAYQPIIVKPAPASVSIAGKTTVKVDSTYTYSIVPNPDHSYKWNVTNGLFTESDTTATVTVKWTMTGNAKLNVVQNLSGCEDTTSINVVVDQLTGLRERSFSNYFSVIPNPNNGRFIININSESDHAQLMLYNSLGALVYSKDDVVSNEEINTQLSPGFYFIVLKNQSGSAMQKLMIR